MFCFVLVSFCFVFSGHMLSFLLGKQLGVKLLIHMVGVCLTFSRIAKLCYQSGCTIFRSPSAADAGSKDFIKSLE